MELYGGCEVIFVGFGKGEGLGLGLFYLEILNFLNGFSNGCKLDLNLLFSKKKKIGFV